MSENQETSIKPMNNETTTMGAEVDVVTMLASLLREAKREHYESDDSPTFSCAASTHAIEFERSCLENFDSSISRPAVCSCGADEWNARIDSALSAADSLVRAARPALQHRFVLFAYDGDGPAGGFADAKATYASYEEALEAMRVRGDIHVGVVDLLEIAETGLGIELQ